MIFTPPPGWTRVPQPDGLGFVLPTKNSQESVTLLLLQDQELNQDFKTTLKSIARSRVKQNERVLQKTEPYPFQSGANVESLFELLIVQNAGREEMRAYTGLHPGNRIDVVVLLTPNPQAFQRNMPVLKEFLSHLQFTNLKQPDSPEPSH